MSHKVLLLIFSFNLRPKRFVFFLLVAFFAYVGTLPQMVASNSLYAQQTPAFNIAIGHDTIGLEDVLRVSFIAENASVESFNPPDFSGWNVVAGPNTSSEMQIINGKVTQRLTYTFFIRAPEEGLHIVGRASATLNGEYLQTEPKLVYVVPGKLHAQEEQRSGFRQLPQYRLPEMRPNPHREQQRRRQLYRM